MLEALAIDDLDRPRLHDLRRYAKGELAGEHRARVETELSSNPRALARLEALQREEERFLATSLAAVESARILARSEEAETEERRPLWWLRLAPALVLGLVFVVVSPLVFDDEGAPGLRTKGADVGLVAYLNAEPDPLRLEDGETLRSGDQLQFEYRAGGHPFVLIVSVDGQGIITPLYPASPGPSVGVRPDGRHILEGSIILDDAIGPEQVFAFFSDEPLAYDEVAAELEALLREYGPSGDLPVPEFDPQDVDVTTFSFLKE